MTVKFINTAYHHQIGWLRRPELDNYHPGHFVYEDADGDLVLSQDERHKHRILLSIWEDTGTGERHATISPLPYFTGTHEEFVRIQSKPKSPQ